MSEEFSFDLDEKSIKNIKEAIGLDEIEARHQRFMNGTETIDDLINHIYHYKIKNNDGLDLELVEKKYYEKIVDLYNKEKEKNKNSISKDKIRKDLETCQKVYEEEMKPYQTEYGLNVSCLSKKEKEQLVNKRNCLITQMKTYEMLLEE